MKTICIPVNDIIMSRRDRHLLEIDYVANGKRIRKARKKQYLTQEQLAEMNGAKSAHISNIESVKRLFRFKSKA